MKKRTKIISLMALVLLMGIASFANINKQFIASFTASGATGCSTTIENGSGYILCETMFADVAADTNMSIYLPTIEMENSADSATNAILLYTDSSNVINGVTLTTDDSFLVYNATSGYQLEGISAVGNWNSTNYTTSYTLDSNTAASDGDPVYFIDVLKVMTFPLVAADDQTDMHSIFAGSQDMPIHIVIPTPGGVSTMGGTYSIVK